MRRLLVLFLAALAVGGGTVASASGRQNATRVIVCPVTASVTTCCGPPIAQPPILCCPGPVELACPPSLSISASPDPMTAGAQVTVSGALTHTAAAGVTVQLWQRAAGDNPFSKAGTATTDASGSWSMTIAAGTVMTNRWWYATAGGLQSATIAEPVSAIVTLHAGAARLSGTVTPAHPRARARLQRLAGTKWVTIARTRLTRHSSFSFARAGLHGTVRVLVAADKENALSASNNLALS
ncbi:MAG TPA: hypothetical protein VGX45_03855 [Solirubrobacteraceae bacterium]|nr:hypothetical protein [Solirubrobacteraceae bacterium]